MFGGCCKQGYPDIETRYILSCGLKCCIIPTLFVFILGNKEFEIPPLEPLHVKSLVIDAGTAPINLRQTLKDVMVTDMISTSKIHRYRYDDLKAISDYSIQIIHTYKDNK